MLIVKLAMKAMCKDMMNKAFFSVICKSVSHNKYNVSILRKRIERYLDSVPSQTFNTIKTKLIMCSFHSSRYLQSNECLIKVTLQ